MGIREKPYHGAKGVDNKVNHDCDTNQVLDEPKKEL